MTTGTKYCGKGFESVRDGVLGKKTHEERCRAKELAQRAGKEPEAMLELSDIAYKQQIRENSIPEC